MAADGQTGQPSALSAQFQEQAQPRVAAAQSALPWEWSGSSKGSNSGFRRIARRSSAGAAIRSRMPADGPEAWPVRRSVRPVIARLSSAPMVCAPGGRALAMLRRLFCGTSSAGVAPSSFGGGNAKVIRLAAILPGANTGDLGGFLHHTSPTGDGRFGGGGCRSYLSAG